MPSRGVARTDTRDCIASVKNIPFKRHPPPNDIMPHVPGGVFVRLVLPLSNTDTLTIYELGNRRADGIELTDPNTVLLITRQGERVFRFSMRNLRLPNGFDPGWGVWAAATNVAHLCSENADITYVVLQAGNQGGFFMALKRDADTYRMMPIKAVAQGKLELNTSTPTRVVVWNVADEDAGDCTACPKHYVVETMDLDGQSLKVVETRKTKRKYTSFQDEPLKVSGER